MAKIAKNPNKRTLAGHGATVGTVTVTFKLPNGTVAREATIPARLEHYKIVAKNDKGEEYDVKVTHGAAWRATNGMNGWISVADSVKANGGAPVVIPETEIAAMFGA